MAQPPTSLAKPLSQHLSPHAAWQLWHRLTDAAETLWEAYEYHFLQFCVDDQHRENACNKSAPIQ